MSERVVNERAALVDIVVPADEGRSRVAESAFRVWRGAVDRLRSRLQRNSPITYNFAREFPLQVPDKAPFFHVARTSVRDLLRTFERRNGVRLWCSVRRSGKTTACLDLGSTSGDSTIVSQTCGQSDREEARRFHESVRKALAAGEMLSDIVRERRGLGLRARRCREQESGVGHRRVRDALRVISTRRRRIPALIRYNVVQPILNQLTSFSYENLLVFLGQEPGAHFILMDQNQLAPFVTQEPFPLFEHASGKTRGEFCVLVDKVLGGRVECASDFLDALFDETAGHPFLTANVLVEFVDWLIETKRPQSALRVDAADFGGFASRRLKADRILSSGEYEFFRRGAADAMSERGFKTNPWLFATYWILRIDCPMTRRTDFARQLPISGS